MGIDRVVADIARAQHGLITWHQALECGMTPGAIRARVAAGRWERVHRGVFRVAGTPSSREQRLLGACLASGNGAVVSHRAAAEIWGLDGPEPGWTEVTVSTQHVPRHAGMTVHRTRDLQARHVARRCGLPITNPMRTIADLGAVCTGPVVEQAMDDALGRKPVTTPGLVRVWRDIARPGRDGSGVLRSLLEEHMPHPGGTRLEKLMLRLHRDHGLPEPEVQFTIRDADGQFIGRVDFCHPPDRVVIEVDGYEKRTSLHAFRHDRARDRRLKAMGWETLRFVWFEVAHTPRAVADEIRPFLPVSLSR